MTSTAETSVPQLGRPLVQSVLVHVAAVGVFTVSGMFSLSRDHWGSEHASSGSVGVDLVRSIPIPRNEGPVNHLANDSKSITPEAPAEPKAKPAAKAPDPNAIEIPDKQAKKTAPKQVATNLIRPREYQPNQVYTRTPQAASSSMFGMQGAGGIDIGPASVLGSRFGAYADLMRQRIAQKWNTADVHASPSARVAVSFTIARNGSVAKVEIRHPSGDYLLDTSAKRAILDANPLPELPREFERGEATVELWFQLKK